LGALFFRGPVDCWGADSCDLPGATACISGPDGGAFCSRCGASALCGGCCLDGACLLGLSQSQCGSGAEDCVACTGGEQRVFAGTGGACVVPEAGACGPANCAGCCDGNVCAVGDQVIACGAGGAECVNCGIYGQACASGACQ
jgi:hypothetical protein